MLDAARVLEGEGLPVRLGDLPAPPMRLYLHGELPRGPVVAVVGTRGPSAEGRAYARSLAAELSAAGVAVASGGAEGIDTAAHEGALDVGGTTLVVAPAGLAKPFPEQNAGLFRRIVERGGAYLSLVPDDAPAFPSTFFPRNGCLVALSHVVIVAEAPFRSGARNAAAWARKLGRPLFVVLHPPWSKFGQGCVPELRAGALPLDRARDVLRLLEVAGHRALPRPLSPWPPVSLGAQGVLPLPARAGEPPDPVLEALRQGCTHADQIAERTGLSPAAVQRRILTLALSGVLVPDPWGALKLVTL